MKLEQFDFYLPEELIAQTPLLKRDTSKLLCIDKKENNYEHKTFSDIIDYFEAGDTLVLNNTRVMPARLYGQKKDTGAAIEDILRTLSERNKAVDILIFPVLVQGKKAPEDIVFAIDFINGHQIKEGIVFGDSI